MFLNMHKKTNPRGNTRQGQVALGGNRNNTAVDATKSIIEDEKLCDAKIVSEDELIQPILDKSEKALALLKNNEVWNYQIESNIPKLPGCFEILIVIPSDIAIHYFKLEKEEKIENRNYVFRQIIDINNEQFSHIKQYDNLQEGLEENTHLLIRYLKSFPYKLSNLNFSNNTFDEIYRNLGALCSSMESKEVENDEAKGTCSLRP